MMVKVRIIVRMGQPGVELPDTASLNVTLAVMPAHAWPNVGCPVAAGVDNCTKSQSTNNGITIAVPNEPGRIELSLAAVE